MSRIRLLGMSVLVAATVAEAASDGTVFPRRTVQRRATARPAIAAEISPQDSLLFLGYLPSPASAGQAALGDSDQDGADELIILVLDPATGFTVRNLEYRPGDIYQETILWSDIFYPYEICDLDRDGKREVLGQYGYWLHLREAPTSSSFPTQLVWQSPALGNILGSAICGDTDRDGNLEIIHSVNTGISKLIIFENKGDNNFQQVYFDVHAPQDDGRKVIADFDGDGLMEIAVCGTYGHLRIYESPSDDVWVHAFDDTTGLDNAYGIAGGQDTDGNGRLELFIAGNMWDRRIFVYESPGPDQYERVRVLAYNDQHTGGLDDALVVTNIDGVGLPELVVKFFREIHIYRAPGPGQWNDLLAAIDPAIGGDRGAIYCMDANRNGRPEVFWLTSSSTLTLFPSMIVEHPGVVPSDVPATSQARIERLVVTPTPSGAATTIRLGPRSAQAAALAFFDASGRLVGRYPHSTGRLDFDFSAAALRPGIYFIRAEGAGGDAIATGRAIVVR